jgi:thiamine-monophosphate kinase
VGDAAAGISLLLDPSLRTDGVYEKAAIERQRSPTPRVKEGALVGALRMASAMIDVSDGIAGDLGHICERSRVSARLVAESLPVRAENRALAKAARGDEWHFALHGGEDYELLITAPPGKAEELSRRITAETGTHVSEIGEILPAGTPPELQLPDGKIRPLGGEGWDHFK